MDLNSKLDFSSMGLPPEGEHSILKTSFIVEIGDCSRVPLVVPFGSLESVVRMALSAGMSVSISEVLNPCFNFFKGEIEGVLKSDV